MNKQKSRIDREKRVAELMISIYCRKKEKNRVLCTSCETLLEYTHNRLDRCGFGESKQACKLCPRHCYKADMRKQIREVMRFSGPRMIFYAPLEAIRHFINPLL